MGILLQKAATTTAECWANEFALSPVLQKSEETPHQSKIWWRELDKATLDQADTAAQHFLCERDGRDDKESDDREW